MRPMFGGISVCTGQGLCCRWFLVGFWVLRVWGKVGVPLYVCGQGLFGKWVFFLPVVGLLVFGYFVRCGQGHAAAASVYSFRGTSAERVSKLPGLFLLVCVFRQLFRTRLLLTACHATARF